MRGIHSSCAGDCERRPYVACCRQPRCGGAGWGNGLVPTLRGGATVLSADSAWV
jgi:hypothetical protein